MWAGVSYVLNNPSLHIHNRTNSGEHMNESDQANINVRIAHAIAAGQAELTPLHDIIMLCRKFNADLARVLLALEDLLGAAARAAA